MDSAHRLDKQSAEAQRGAAPAGAVPGSAGSAAGNAGGQSAGRKPPPPPRTLNEVSVDQMRRLPLNSVVRDITVAARDAKLLTRPEFRRLVGYLAEQADGRDRREPLSTRTGDARQVPRLRLLMEQCFGVYADLHWFRINKAANQSGQPLRGVFSRAAAAFARVPADRFAALAEALISEQPDGALQRVLQETHGRVPGLGVEVFSWLCHLYRRDLYFVVPRAFGESSGLIQYVGADLRRYCALCRDLRGVCDELGFPGDIRGAALLYLLDQPVPPLRVQRALHGALGPSVAGQAVLSAAEADTDAMRSDAAAQPIEYAVRAIRMRRGPAPLRDQMLAACGDACAMTGACVRDLLEVACIVPFPDGDVHAPGNALLLRSDLHTLFDLNLVAIDPQAMSVRIAPSLRATGYRKLDGRAVTRRRDNSAPDAALLRERWRVFQARHGAALEAADAVADPDAGSEGERGSAVTAEPGHTESAPVIEAAPAGRDPSRMWDPTRRSTPA